MRTYLDSDVDADALVLLPLVRSVIPLLGGVVAHDEGVLGELFVETLGSASIDVEVQGLRRSHEGCERKQGPHVGVRAEGSSVAMQVQLGHRILLCSQVFRSIRQRQKDVVLCEGIAIEALSPCCGGKKMDAIAVKPPFEIVRRSLSTRAVPPREAATFKESRGLRAPSGVTCLRQAAKRAFPEPLG